MGNADRARAFAGDEAPGTAVAAGERPGAWNKSGVAKVSACALAVEAVDVGVAASEGAMGACVDRDAVGCAAMALESGARAFCDGAFKMPAMLMVLWPVAANDAFATSVS